jgi:hypothetical protein
MYFFFFWNLFFFFFFFAISTNSAKHHIQLLSILKLAHIHPSLVLCWNLCILNKYSNWRPFTIRETIMSIALQFIDRKTTIMSL